VLCRLATPQLMLLPVISKSSWKIWKVWTCLGSKGTTPHSQVLLLSPDNPNQPHNARCLSLRAV